MAADEATRIVIGLDLILRNLEKTLSGLSQVEKQLRSVADIKIGGTANFDKAAQSAQRLQLQQQKLSIQAQELSNRQERASQTADRLALSQLRLESAFSRAANAEAKASATKVSETQRAASEVARINAETVRQANEQQDLRIKSAKTLADVQIREAQRGAGDFADGLDKQRKALADTAHQQEAFGNSLRSLGQGLTSVGFALSVALTAPLVALGKSGLDAAVTLDSLKRGLTAIVGSAAEAETQLRRLTEIARLPGIGFQEAIQGSIRLQAVGFSAKDAEKALIEFSNAIALTGGGREELARVTTQLGQLAAKGKVLSQDLRPIIEAAPAVGTALKQAFGTVNADDIAKLTGSSEEFFQILVKQLELLPRASAGAKNAFENFKDSIFRASAVIGDTLIPVLTKLADVALPIVEKLAAAFAALPFPLRALIVVSAGVAAALGPVLIIVGQLVVGIGRLNVAQAQLALQSGAAAAGLEAEAVAAGEAAVATGALSGVLKGFGGPITILLSALAALGVAYLFLADSTEKATEVDVASEKARQDRLASLQDEVKFLESLSNSTKLTADEEQRFLAIQKAAEPITQGKLALLDSEKQKIDALIESKREQIKLDQFAATATASQAGQNVITALNAQRAAQDELTKAKQRFSQAEIGAAESSNLFGARQIQVSDIEAERAKSAVDAAKALGKLKDAQDEIGKQARIFIELAQATGLSVDALLALARQGGLTAEQELELKRAVDAVTGSMQQGTTAANAYFKSLQAADTQLLEAGERAAEVEKRQRQLIGSAKDLALSASSSFEGALKFMKAFIAANPDLLDAVRKQAQVAQQSIDEFLRTTLGGKKGDTGTALRNAQVALEKALADVQEAVNAQQLQTEKDHNEALRQANDAAFKLQLRSYIEFLTFKQKLDTDDLDKEIANQAKRVVLATKTAAKLAALTTVGGISTAERVRREAQTKEAEKATIEAQTKLNALTEKRALNQQNFDTLIRLSNQQQEKDIRQLDIAYAELKGHVEDALKAQVAEQFRDKLIALGQAQEFITKQLTDSTAKLTAEQRVELQQARQRNQTEIDRIGSLQRVTDALDVLKVAEQFVTDSKQKQKDLEDDLSFQVNFRGKQELSAIRARLQGEDQLKQRLLVSRDIVQSEIDRLQKLGEDVPKNLQKFVDQINLEVKGLGELDFTDQFRLVQQQFDKFNDARIAKINDVERAVAHRDISEIEGLIAVRKANGEYVKDLEDQVVVLQQIATASNDPRLQQQAENARQTAADVRAATTEFASFGKQLRSVSIDALQKNLEDFFSSFTDRTKTAREKILDLFKGLEQSIVDFIAKDFSRRIVESIFGSPEDQQQGVGGLIASVKKLLGIGGGAATAGTGDVVGHAGDIAQHGAAAATGTEAGAALITGATTAGTAMATGGATAGTSLATSGVTLAASITTAAAGFATAVVAAGATFAATVAASSAAQAAIGGAGNALGSLAGAAAGDFITPQPQGRIIRVAEAGFPEAVLTTDPRHANRQANILREYLSRTRGLFGRIPNFAEGGFASPRQAELSMLSSLSGSSAPSPSTVNAANAANRQRNLRVILVSNEDEARNWFNSPEGDQVLVEKLTRNRPVIRRLAN